MAVFIGVGGRASERAVRPLCALPLAWLPGSARAGWVKAEGGMGKEMESDSWMGFYCALVRFYCTAVLLVVDW